MSEIRFVASRKINELCWLMKRVHGNGLPTAPEYETRHKSAQTTRTRGEDSAVTVGMVVFSPEAFHFAHPPLLEKNSSSILCITELYLLPSL